MYYNRMSLSTISGGDGNSLVKSSTEQAIQGTNDTVYMTPLKVKAAIDFNSSDNTEVIKSILVAQGLSGEYGFFADGFTYVNEGDVCISTDNKIWIYVGAGAPNQVVAAGTVPSVGAGYERLGRQMGKHINSL